jgi:hypothetical protein
MQPGIRGQPAAGALGTDMHPAAPR